MATKTISDVELVASGTWNASQGGRTTITRADLEAMLDASADVDHAPLKLGHRSSLNSELGDGAPAYGWVVPTRIENRNGRDVLIGDLKDVPAKLADAIPSSYRRRSAEIGWGVKGGSGMLHKAALVGLALLGVAAPAVKGLADIVSMHSDLDVEDTSVVTWFADQDPALTEAELEWAARTTAAELADDTLPVNDSSPAVVNDGPMTDNPKEAAVTAADVREQLKALLDQDGDTEIRDMIARVVASNTPDEPAAPAPVEDQKPEGGEPAPGAPAPVEEPSKQLATALSDDTVVLTKAVFAEMQETVKWANAQRKQAALEGAVKAGRISPAEMATFSDAYDRDAEGTTTLLSSLASRFPVTEFGADQAPDNTDVDQAVIDAYINRPFNGN